MHLSDPPGSTPPRDCAAAEDGWLCRRVKTAPKRQKLDIARADCLEAAGESLTFGFLPETRRWTNRPSFQQIIGFDSQGPR
jgi:hypothetical protein